MDRVQIRADVELKVAAGFALWLMLALALPLVLGLPLAYSLVGVIFALALVPACLSARAGRFDLLEIIHPIMFLSVVYFGVRTLYVLTVGVEDASRPEFFDELNRALLYVVGGLTTLLGGYYCGVGERLADRATPRAPNVARRPTLFVIAALLVLGFVCRAWVYANGSYTRFIAGQREQASGLMMAVDFGGWLSYYGLIAAAALACRPEAGRGLRLMFWLVLVPVTFTLAFFGGAKSELMFLALGVLLARHYLAQRVTAPMLILAAALFLCAFPIVNSYRTISGANADVAPHRVVSLIPEALDDETADAGFVGAVWQSVLTRVPGIDALALVVKYTPEIMPFQHGRTMIIAPLIAFVPMMLWPGKYEFINAVASGVNFGSDYFGIENNASGVAITQLGELYLNFGPLGIPIGMFIIGVLCRLTYHWFRERGRTPLGLLIYACVYFHMIFIEGWFGSTYANALKHLVVTSLIAWLCVQLGASAPPAPRRGEAAR